MSDLRGLFEKVEQHKAEFCDGDMTNVVYSLGYKDALNWVLDAIEDVETGVA